MDNIPPTRHILLIQDGHSSHMSIEAIEYSKVNGIFILCLPSHTSHILQPLDIGVFKSFKTYFSKAGARYMADHPGCVITTDKLASLVADAWPHALTQLNIMSGFQKSGLFPFNPSVVDDRCTAPAKVFHTSNGTSSKSKIENPMSVVNDDCHSKSSDLENEQELFSPEQEKLFAKCYEEGYNLADPTYIAWLKLNHADRCVSVSSDAALSESTAPSSTVPKSKSSTSSDVLSEILALPSVPPQQKHRNAMNNKAVCVTDMLDDLKLQEAKKMEEKALAEEKRKEKERIRKEKAEKAEERKKKKKLKRNREKS